MSRRFSALFILGALLSACGVETLQEANNPKKTCWRLEAEVDRGLDGIIDHRRTFNYERRSDETLIIEEFDRDLDGVPDLIRRATLNDLRKPTLQELDTDGDGTVDRRTERTYDADGNLFMETFEAPGLVANRAVHTYDAFGNRLSSEYINRNDKVISRSVYGYDDMGNRTSSEWDAKGDGIPEGITRTTYDDQGREIESTYDSDELGRSRWTVRYDGDRTIRELWDADGTLKRRRDSLEVQHAVSRPWDIEIWDESVTEPGPVLVEESDYQGDGIIDYRRTFTRNSLGWVVADLREYPSGDTELTTSTYECF